MSYTRHKISESVAMAFFFVSNEASAVVTSDPSSLGNLNKHVEFPGFLCCCHDDALPSRFRKLRCYLCLHCQLLAKGIVRVHLSLVKSLVTIISRCRPSICIG